LQHKYAQVNGINMHYVEEGPETGEVLVLVHGFPEFWYCWHHQISFLANEGYRLIVPDMRGFGETSAPTDNDSYSMKNLCKDLEGLLDHVGVRQAIFIGHDWGGVAVWRMALWHPDRVRGVIGVCTPYRPRSPTYVPLEVIAEKNPVFAYQIYFNKEDGKVANDEFTANVPRFVSWFFRTTRPEDRIGKFMAAGFMEDGLFKSFPENPPRSPLFSDEEYNKYVENFSRTGFRGGLRWYTTTHINWHQEEEAKLQTTIPHPSLMVTAGRDVVLTPKLSEGMEAHIPNLKRAHIEETGHWITHEQPDRLNQIFIEWLRTLPKASI